jgi:hypothetical protein
LTGRPGYPIRSMVGLALAKLLYAIPMWTRIVAFTIEHTALAAAIASDGDVSSVFACYRFTASSRAFKPTLDAGLDSVAAALHAPHPEMGRDVAMRPHGPAAGVNHQDDQRRRDDVRARLIDSICDRGFKMTTTIMDMGYDNGPIHDGCMGHDVCPIAPLRLTPAVVRGDHKAPCCEHGEWTFAGADYTRRARNGAARPEPARPHACGSRPTACTR